jgi:hypothetical protein
MKITFPIAIVLDTTPLGLLTQKKGIAEAEACRAWADGLSQFGCCFFVPEIADYELRREFVRQGNTKAVRYPSHKWRGLSLTRSPTQ